MKEKILMLIIGILIGAIVASACFLLFYKGNTSINQNIENGRPNMENFTPGDRPKRDFKGKINNTQQETTTEKTETNSEAKNSENQNNQSTNNQLPQMPSGESQNGQIPSGQVPSGNPPSGQMPSEQTQNSSSSI